MKIARHTKILELIEQEIIETQEELALRLKNEGFPVTQATVSRDIREMKLTKVSMENGRQRYSSVVSPDVEMSDKLTKIFREAVVKMDYSQNILVIKTLSGMGSAVGAAIDNMPSVEILGTIAGDDTVLCVVRNHNQAGAILERLYRVIHD